MWWFRTPYSEFETLANDKYMTAKAFDNRYGCALAIDVLNELKDETIDNPTSSCTVAPEYKLISIVSSFSSLRTSIANAQP
jgi:putative aminopeptidase FrvX